MEFKVEIFAVGKWNGMTFSKKDLEGIAANFKKLLEVLRVPLKMGHNDDQPMTDGQPAIGWVTNVELINDKLIATFSDVPDIVIKAIDKKLYRNVSVELFSNFDYKGEHYDHVLSAVALLGADIPAVNTLADLGTYIGREEIKASRSIFTAIENNQSSEEIMDIQELEKLKKENEDLKMAKANIEKEMFAKKVSDHRSVLSGLLEDAVKENKILPVTRDAFMKTMKFETDKVLDVSKEEVSAFISTFKTQKQAEQAQMTTSIEKYSANPGEELHDLAIKKMEFAKGLNYEQALFSVMRENKELAKKHVNVYEECA